MNGNFTEGLPLLVLELFHLTAAIACELTASDKTKINKNLNM